MGLVKRPAKADPREAQRRDAAALLAHVPEGSLSERVDAARDFVQEALISGALEKAAGNRTVAAAALNIPDERVADALRRYPWLAKRWPAKRGRPPKGAPSSPGAAAAHAGGIRRSPTGDENR